MLMDFSMMQPMTEPISLGSSTSTVGFEPTKPTKMAEEGNHDIPHGIATVTSGFQDRPLAFRVIPPK